MIDYETERKLRIEVNQELCRDCELIDFCSFDCQGYIVALERKIKEKEKCHQEQNLKNC